MSLEQNLFGSVFKKQLLSVISCIKVHDINRNKIDRTCKLIIERSKFIKYLCISLTKMQKKMES